MCTGDSSATEIREKCVYHVTRRVFNFGCNADVDEPSSARPEVVANSEF